MSHKVVIIDDNAILIESLTSNIAWENKDCRIVGTARNGQDGLVLIRGCQPDIILSDIRMPGEDGLSMLEASRTDAKIIIISAYEDFTYARRAIRLNVVDYITKPVRIETLSASIDRAVAALDTVGDRQHDANALHAAKICQDWLYRRIQLSAEETSVPDMLSDWPRYGFLTVALFPKDGGSAILPDVMADMLERVEPLFYPVDTRFGQQCTIIWLFLKKMLPYEQARLGTRMLLQYAQERLRDYHIILSPCLYRGQDDVHAAYKDAISLCSQLSFGMNPEEIKSPPKEERQRYTMERAAQASARFRRRLLDEQAPPEEITLFLDQISGFCHYDGFLIKSILIQFVYNFVHSQCEAPEKEQLDLNRYFYRFRECENLSALKELAVTAMRQIMKSLAGKHSYSAVVNRSIQYIYANIQKQISLASTAQALGISPNYLSTIIKRETGENYHSILCAARMSFAKRCLREGEYSIAAIGDMIQYKNYATFYKAFKAHTGLSPNDYRRMHRGVKDENI